jgi:hypothetical protein
MNMSAFGKRRPWWLQPDLAIRGHGENTPHPSIRATFSLKGRRNWKKNEAVQIYEIQNGIDLPFPIIFQISEFATFSILTPSFEAQTNQLDQCFARSRRP